MSYLSVCVILVQEPANNPWASWQIPTILVMVRRKNLWGSYFRFERNRINHIVQPTLWCLKPHLVLTSFSLTPPSCDSQGSQLRILEGALTVVLTISVSIWLSAPTWVRAEQISFFFHISIFRIIEDFSDYFRISLTLYYIHPT